MVWPTLGSRTAKEQNRTAKVKFLCLLFVVNFFVFVCQYQCNRYTPEMFAQDKVVRLKLQPEEQTDLF